MIMMYELETHIVVMMMEYRYRERGTILLRGVYYSVIFKVQMEMALLPSRNDDSKKLIRALASAQVWKQQQQHMCLFLNDEICSAMYDKLCHRILFAFSSHRVRKNLVVLDQRQKELNKFCTVGWGNCV